MCTFCSMLKGAEIDKSFTKYCCRTAISFHFISTKFAVNPVQKDIFSFFWLFNEGGKTSFIADRNAVIIAEAASIHSLTFKTLLSIFPQRRSLFRPISVEITFIRVLECLHDDVFHSEVSAYVLMDYFYCPKLLFDIKRVRI